MRFSYHNFTPRFEHCLICQNFDNCTIQTFPAKYLRELRHTLQSIPTFRENVKFVTNKFDKLHLFPTLSKDYERSLQTFLSRSRSLCFHALGK